MYSRGYSDRNATGGDIGAVPKITARRRLRGMSPACRVRGAPHDVRCWNNHELGTITEPTPLGVGESVSCDISDPARLRRRKRRAGRCTYE